MRRARFQRNFILKESVASNGFSLYSSRHAADCRHVIPKYRLITAAYMLSSWSRRRRRSLDIWWHWYYWLMSIEYSGWGRQLWWRSRRPSARRLRYFHAGSSASSAAYGVRFRSASYIGDFLREDVTPLMRDDETRISLPALPPQCIKSSGETKIRRQVLGEGCFDYRVRKFCIHYRGLSLATKSQPRILDNEFLFQLT